SWFANSSSSSKSSSVQSSPSAQSSSSVQSSSSNRSSVEAYHSGSSAYDSSPSSENGRDTRRTTGPASSVSTPSAVTTMKSRSGTSMTERARECMALSNASLSPSRPTSSHAPPESSSPGSPAARITVPSKRARRPSSETEKSATARSAL